MTSDGQAAPEQRLLADALKAMEPLGLQFRVLRQETRNGDHRADATIGLRFGGRQLRYVAEVKRGLRPATLGAVIHQLRAYGGPPSGDGPRDATSGRRLAGPGRRVHRRGGQRVPESAARLGLRQGPAPYGSRRPALERGRAFQATGLQVLFALLARPELVARPYREIAAAAGVAHGTVGWVMAELPGLGYLAKVGGRRRLINGERLLDRWTEAYARTLRPRLLLGRFRGDMAALHARTAQWPEDLLVGGELAAARLTRHLRPGTATFYAQAIDPKVLLKLVLKADAEGNVDVQASLLGLPR